MGRKGARTGEKGEAEEGKDSGEVEEETQCNGSEGEAVEWRIGGGRMIDVKEWGSRALRSPFKALASSIERSATVAAYGGSVAT